MSHNTYPVRRIVAAGALLIGGAAVEGCSNDTPATPESAPNVTTTVHTPDYRPSQKYREASKAADANLQTVSFATARQIIADTANPATRMEADIINQTSFLSNKRTVNNDEQPAIRIAYNSERDRLVLQSGFNLEADADNRSVHFVGLVFKADAETSDFAGQKIAAGDSLDAQDYQQLLTGADLREVRYYNRTPDYIWRDQDAEFKDERVYLYSDQENEYTDDFYGTPTPAKISKMSQVLESTADLLHSEIPSQG